MIGSCGQSAFQRTATGTAVRQSVRTSHACQRNARVQAQAPPSPPQSDTLTTNTGAPVADNTNSLTAGARGPVLLEDFNLLEKIAQFDREQIPERIVHARGAAAFGEFEVTQDCSDITDMEMLTQKGMSTPVQARFSTVVHPRGSPESLRDVRGFTVRFQTQQGNWDLVGNNMPVFFVRDGLKFPDMVHALKQNPKTHEQEWWRILDFFSFHPESAHIMTWLLDDVGIPKDYRHMDGFGVHTFCFTKGDKNTWVKFHWHTDQGVENLSDDDAVMVGGVNAGFATNDLFTNIRDGNYPSWTLKIQTMDPATQDDYEWDPLDATIVWPEEQFPYREVGKMTLNRNPKNFFSDNEQMAFSPSNVVPGITFTNDKLLQSRLFSYSDAQRYRIGVNYLELPINKPLCPFHQNQYEGSMQMLEKDEEVDYWPSNFKPEEHTAEKSVSPNHQAIEGERTKQQTPKQVPFLFPGKRYREFDTDRQDRLAMRIAMKMTQPRVTDEIRDKWFDIWKQCDEDLHNKVKQKVGEMLS